MNKNFVFAMAFVVLFSGLASAFYFGSFDFSSQRFKFNMDQVNRAPLVIPYYSGAIDNVAPAITPATPAEYVRFTINSNIRGPFEVNLRYNSIPRGGVNQVNNRVAVGRVSSGQTTTLVVLGNNRRISNYELEVCYRNRCVVSERVQ